MLNKLIDSVLFSSLLALAACVAGADAADNASTEDPAFDRSDAQTWPANLIVVAVGPEWDCQNLALDGDGLVTYADINPFVILLSTKQ